QPRPYTPEELADMPIPTPRPIPPLVTAPAPPKSEVQPATSTPPATVIAPAPELQPTATKTATAVPTDDDDDCPCEGRGVPLIPMSRYDPYSSEANLLCYLECYKGKFHADLFNLVKGRKTSLILHTPDPRWGIGKQDEESLGVEVAGVFLSTGS